MEIYFDNNYPINISKALSLLHELDKTQEYKVFRTHNIENINKENSVVFLMDFSKKGHDIIIDKHFEEGYKVFAFKWFSSDDVNVFQITLMTFQLWSKILKTISKETNPFVYTFTYKGKNLIKVK